MKDFTKELEFEQDVVKRMAENSFKIKGWAVTLTSAILFLSDGSIYQYVIAILPILCFWYLDAYYIHQERLYRRLYLWVVENRATNSDYAFSLNAHRFIEDEVGIIRVMFSKTLLIFYGMISFLAIIILSIKIIGL